MNTTHVPSLRFVLPAIVLAGLLLGVGLGGPREQKPDPKPQDKEKSTAERLTSRPCRAAPADPVVKVGEDIETAAGQRRRIAFGQARVFVNQQTLVKFPEVNRIELVNGEIYVELPEKAAKGFVIGTPRGKVNGNEGDWAIRTNAKGTGLAVTRGMADLLVKDKKIVVRAGNQTVPGSDTTESLPRASHLLDWTKDLMAAAASPLVPGSEFAGGSLIAKDPDGQEAKITLRKFHVDVHIEDGFARTTIDQTYFNHESWQLEGTF